MNGNPEPGGRLRERVFAGGGCGHAVAVGLLATLAALFAAPAAAQTTCTEDTVQLTHGSVAS